MIERVSGIAGDLAQPPFEIVLESLRQGHIGNVTARHAHEVMVVTKCELGKFVTRSVLLHTRNTVDDTGGNEYREVPVQRTLDESATRLE